MSGHHHKLCSLTIHQFICDFLNLLLFKFLIFLPACQQASQAGRWTGRQASFYIGLHCVYFSRRFLRDMSPFYFILFLFYGLLILILFFAGLILFRTSLRSLFTPLFSQHVLYITLMRLKSGKLGALTSQSDKWAMRNGVVEGSRLIWTTCVSLTCANIARTQAPSAFHLHLNVATAARIEPGSYNSVKYNACLHKSKGDIYEEGQQ